MTNIINSAVQFTLKYLEEQKLFTTSLAYLAKQRQPIKTTKITSSVTKKSISSSKSLIDKTDDLKKRLVDWENDAKAKI